MKKRTFITGLAALALAFGSAGVIGGVSLSANDSAIMTRAASLSAVLWDSSNTYAASGSYTTTSDGAIKFKNSAANKYSNPTRLYQNNVFTIEIVDGKATTITSVIAVCASQAYGTAFGGTSATPTGDGSLTRTANDAGTTVTFTATGTVTKIEFKMSAQSRVSSLTVNYENDAKTLTGVSIKAAPTKTEYFEATKFDPTGLVITASYGDGSTEDVAYSEDTKDKFSFSPSLSTNLTTSDKEVTITYSDPETGSATVKQAITVNEDTVVSLSLEGSSFEGKIFKLNGSWGTDGLVAKITRASGNVSTLGINDSKLTLAFDPATPNSTDLTSVKVTATYDTSITADITLSGFVVSDVQEVTYDFVTNFETYAKDWTNAYGEHSVSSTDLGASVGAKINLVCNKNTQTITTMPVFNSAEGITVIDFNLTQLGYKIAEASVKFSQWSTAKAPKFSMYSGAYDNSKSPLSSLSVTSTDLTLTGNPNSDSFSVVVDKKDQAGLESITVAIAKDNDSINAANTWAQSFLDGTASSCADYNADNLEKLSADSVWPALKTSFDGLSDIAQKLIKAQTGNGDSIDALEQAVARYDHIVNRYASLTDFLGRRTATSTVKSAFFGNNNNDGTNLAIVITCAVAAAALSATFILRKKKQDR